MTAARDAIMHAIYGMDVCANLMPICELNLQGWNSATPVLRELVEERRPSVIVDVGVWKGGSTLHFAKLLHDNRIDGVVIAVDTFLGSVEHWAGGEAKYLPPRQHGRPTLYEQFLSNVFFSGLSDYVVPLPQTSVCAAELLGRLNVRADLVHIDASHDYDSVLQDARRYWNFLKLGGMLVGDDYNSGWPSVMAAADQFAIESGRELVNADPKWIVRK